MCGRYYVDAEGIREVLGLDFLVSWEKSEICWGREGKGKSADTCPGQRAPVLAKRNGSIGLEMMRWGFLQASKKNLLINARAETVMKKPVFADSVRLRRCVVPANRFYEWDREKNKAEFACENGILFMAGIFDCFGEEDHFVILTTEANASVRPVHDRMPLLLEREEIQEWICSSRLPEKILGKTPGLLSKKQDYEQQTLFGLLGANEESST